MSELKEYRPHRQWPRSEETRGAFFPFRYWTAIILLLAVAAPPQQLRCAPPDGSEQESYRSHPLPVTSGVSDYRRAQKEQQAWAKRLQGGLASRTSDPSAPWRKKRDQFLEIVLPSPDDQKPLPNWRDVESRGRDLYEAGCREPVVMFHYLMAAVEEPESWRTGRKLADETCDSLRKAEAPSGILIQALTKAIWICRKTRDFKAMKTLDSEALGLLPKLWEDGSFLPEEQPLLVADVLDLNEECTHRQPEGLLKWLEKENRLEPWSKNTLLGDAYVSLAWKKRGDKWAKDVTEEQWKGFHENLDIARKYLREAWQARPDRPYAAACMIPIAMAGGEGENLREWFDRAVAAEVDYPPAYGRYSLALRPRWSGSHEELLAFGEECLATGRFDTIIPGQYDRTVEGIVTDYKQGNEDIVSIYRRPEVAANLCKLGRGLLKDPRWASERADIAAKHAARAWVGQLYKEAGEFLAAATPVSVEGQRPFFESCGVTPDFFRSDLAIRLRHPGSPYLKAEDPRARLSRPERVALYGAAVKDLAVDEDSSTVAIAPLFRLKPLEWEETYERGDWAPIPIEEGLPGWKIVSGDWKRDSAGGLAGRIRPTEPPLIHWLGTVGPNYEIRGDIEIIPQDQKLIRMTGLILGALPRDNDAWIFYELWNDVTRQTSTFLKKMELKSQKPIPTPFADTNSLHVACWDGKLWVKVNGRTIHQGVTFDPAGEYLPGRPDGIIGFGAHFNQTGTTMIFKNWSARKLVSAPSEADFPPASVP